MALASNIQGEEYYRVDIGQGMYTSDLPSNIPDGFSAVSYNTVATGDSIENRTGIRQSTIDWKRLEQAPKMTPGLSGSSDDQYYFCQINPHGLDSSKPAFAWAANGWNCPADTVASNTLNMVRASGASGAGDGFLSTILSYPCLGICQYQDVIYLSLYSQGVHKITAIDWSADTVTLVQLPTTAGGTLRNLFTFKDRIWGFGVGSNSNKLYFTDLPATPGAQPETWAFATNVIPFVGPRGAGVIKQIVPLGNKLAVFTTNGLFTLLVEGAPASWILRLLDSKSISSTRQTGFEANGIIYYVNTKGVWATNCLSCTKLSGSIDDQFFLAKGSRVHTIVPYEDGMIISVGKTTGTDNNFLDKDNCVIYYSQLDPIAFSAWNVNSYGLGTFNDKIGFIWSMTDKIATYLNADPVVFAMVAMTDSTAAVPRKHVIQILVMDGHEDKYWDRGNVTRTQPVGMYIKTKHFDGGNPYNLKQAKRGIMEVYTSDAEHQFTTSWDIDDTVDEASEVSSTLLQESTVGVGSNLVQVPNQFHYRRASFNIRTTLQSANSQVKIKDIALAQNTGRGEYELVR